jgi:hypothetical protein
VSQIQDSVIVECRHGNVPTERRHWLGFSYLNSYTAIVASVGLTFSFTSLHKQRTYCSIKVNNLAINQIFESVHIHVIDLQQRRQEEGTSKWWSFQSGARITGYSYCKHWVPTSTSYHKQNCKLTHRPKCKS